MYKSELAVRFSQYHERIGNLCLLLPTFIKDENRVLDNLKQMQEMYLPHEKIENLLSEYRLWCKKWEGNSEELTAIETFEKCNKHFFPLIRKLVQILATLPVSTSTAERSFSSLKCIKTYLRNAMGQERLNGLTLLNIYRNITIEPLEIVNRLSQRRKRLKLLI